MNAMKVLRSGPRKKTVLTSGHGSKVVDENGKEYLDLQSGCWSNVLGYANDELNDPIVEQIRTLTHVLAAFRTKEIDDAMDELSKALPPELSRVAFLSSGSEAVDLALKIACAATGKNGFVVNERGYYGATAYTLSVGVAGPTASYLPDPGPLYKVPAPLCNHCEHSNREDCAEFKCLDLLKTLVEEEIDDIAAIIYEPILGGGIFVPPIGYGAKLREYADALGVYLIANEVTTGGGKTGKMCAFMHDGIVPDILALGKAIGAGFPVSMVVTTEKVEKMCGGTLYHVQSHQNDALTGKVIQTMLQLLEKHELVKAAGEKGEYWLKELDRIKEELPVIVDVRGRGLMMGVELGMEYASEGLGIQDEMIEKGYLMDFHKASNTFRFFPPYIITFEEIDEFNKAFRETLDAHMYSM